MERWLGKVAVVTGAGAGIGAQIAIELANAGLVVVGLARRVERVEELKSKISTTTTGALHPFKCDVTSEDDIKKAFSWTIERFGGVDVLVNNAGIAQSFKLIDADNTEKIRKIIDTNVLGVVLCTREAFQSMKSRNFDGHIITINSIYGHKVPNRANSDNIYPPSKNALTAMTEVLRQEFQKEKTAIKITSISPGCVKTGPEESYKTMPFLDTEDISQAVIYVLSTKPHVQVHELIIKPIGEIQ